MTHNHLLAMTVTAGWLAIGASCGSDPLSAVPTESVTCPEGDTCDDGNPCTKDDHCASNSCIGTHYVCDDGNGCTADFCNGDGTCEYIETTLACDDGNPCTVNDQCGAGSCSGTPYSCDDGDPCTLDSCNGDGTCSYVDSDCPEVLPPETTVWTGSYECALAQGLTGLNLTTTRDPTTNAMTGIFAFFPLPENPDIPSGSWAMEGNYYPADNSMILLPTEWIDQPSGWQMVGMQGTYDGPQQLIHGKILLANGDPNPFCQTFDLSRVP